MFSEDYKDVLIEKSLEMGVTVPRTEACLKLAHATMTGKLVHANLEDEELGEFNVNLCHNGCCINYTALSELDKVVGEMIAHTMGSEVGMEYMNDHAFRITGFQDFN
jgi:hypothetical protein